MEVKLLHNTPLSIAVRACLTCTGNEDKTDSYNIEDFLTKIVINNGHESTIEHIYYNFEVNNISRSMLQELARHRHISLSVQSTRWSMKKIIKNLNINEIFPNFNKKWQKELNEKYTDILNIISNESANGEPNDELKYYLPEAFKTNLIITLNARELRHIFELRTSKRALKEFREFCKLLYSVIPNDHKFLYKNYFEE